MQDVQLCQSGAADMPNKPITCLQRTPQCYLMRRIARLSVFCITDQHSRRSLSIFRLSCKTRKHTTLVPTQHVPNSPLPVLIYRNVLQGKNSEDFMTETIEANGWLKGGTFKHYPTHHFHSVTHECYAAFQGSSRMLLGRGPLDDRDGSVEVDVQAGDIIVLPAGVSHSNLESKDGYSYVGLYPKGSPHYDNNWCKADSNETAAKAANARAVPLPDFDPIYGRNGPLCQDLGAGKSWVACTVEMRRSRQYLMVNEQHRGTNRSRALYILTFAHLCMQLVRSSQLVAELVMNLVSILVSPSLPILSLAALVSASAVLGTMCTCQQNSHTKSSASSPISLQHQDDS